MKDLMAASVAILGCIIGSFAESVFPGSGYACSPGYVYHFVNAQAPNRSSPGRALEVTSRVSHERLLEASDYVTSFPFHGVMSR